MSHALLCSALIFSASAAVANPKPMDQISVIVNDSVILNSEVESRMNDIMFQAKQRNQPAAAPEQLRTQAREQLILESLQLQLADRNGIRADENAVNAILTGMARENKMTLDAFRIKLDATPGTSFATLRNAVAREQVIERLRQRRMGERIRITDADINQFMSTPAGTELNRQLDEQLKPKATTTPTPSANVGSGVEYLITQVLLPVEERTPVQEQARRAEQAQAMLAAQRRGLSPEEVVTTLRGSDTAVEPLGWRTLDAMPALLAEALKRQIDGEPAELTRTSRGWHLLWISDRRVLRPQENLLPPPPPVPTTVVTQRQVRHILMRPNELQNEDDILEVMNRYHKQLKAGADFAELARLHSQDPGSAVRGGDLGWVSPGDMVPEFDRMIGITPINAISTPFRSEFGYHILRVEGEREQDMRDSILRDRARQILFARAYDEELGAWLRELRAEAYVDYRGQR
ncbi:MAG: peptidylprolyl isomerase [Moraxellaceae bacterium]|nr:peptidylprolyl isomerase [Moraxellaceae bacterium]